MSNQPSYTPEEHAAAWAAYYAQQGYDASQIAAMSSGYNQASASTSSSGAQAYGSYSSGPSGGLGMSTDPSFDADLLQQSSAYLPGGNVEAPKTSKAKQQPQIGKRDTVIRKAGGRVWEDPTLLEWDPKWYRLFVGDVSNDVNERILDEAFRKYPTYCKCKVVRDRLSQKAKYAFIAFKDPEDFLRAWKEMDGKYVGNRPIRLSKIKDDKYGSIATTTVGVRKSKELDKLRRNRGKPLDGRPTPW